MKSWFVADDSLSVVDGGLELDVRLPWYRSLPLSALDLGQHRHRRQPDRPRSDHGQAERRGAHAERAGGTVAGVLVRPRLRLPADPLRGRQSGEEQYDVEITLVIHPPYVPNVFFPAMHHKRMRAN